MRLFRYRERD